MQTVLFLCPHGGVKSVIAACHFNRVAAEHGMPFVSIAAAAEEPYDQVPPAIADRLRSDGYDVQDRRIDHVEPDQLQSAARIISIGCASTHWSGVSDRWDDVPQAGDDLERTIDAIRRHVEALIDELNGNR